MFSKASFFDKAKQILDNRWRAIKKLSEIEDFGIGIPSDIRQAISSSVNSRTKSYRYVLPTQILAKLTQEQGRRRMLQFVGKQLDEHADLTHRQAWRDFLCSI